MIITGNTFYTLNSKYTKEEIDNAFKLLDDKDKQLIFDKYGKDLKHPTTPKNWSQETSSYYYGELLDKFVILLRKERIMSADKKKKEILSNSSDINTTVSKITIEDAKTAKLIKMLNEKKSLGEICKTIDADNQELYKMLSDIRQYGKNIQRSYYSDGTIKYSAADNFSNLYKQNEYTQTIITGKDEKSIKFLVISDLHYGNKMARKDLVDNAYNYCAKKGIHIILCCGDWIDGTFTKGKRSIRDVRRQAEYFVNNYPSDRKIITIGTEGDHDASARTEYNTNLAKICKENRHDIVILEHNTAKINVKNDVIYLIHDSNGKTVSNVNIPIAFIGHNHYFGVNKIDNTINVHANTMSNILTKYPTGLVFKADFTNGYISNIELENIYFNENNEIINEFNFELDRENPNVEVQNEEDYKNTSNVKRMNTPYKVRKPISIYGGSTIIK